MYIPAAPVSDKVGRGNLLYSVSIDWLRFQTETNVSGARWTSYDGTPAGKTISLSFFFGNVRNIITPQWKISQRNAFRVRIKEKGS